MLYCPNCQVLCPEDRCPSCGGKKLRRPEGGDPVLLMTAAEGKADLISSLLDENRIPHEIRACGLDTPTVYGRMPSNRNLFVPYAALKRCEELLRDSGIV